MARKSRVAGASLAGVAAAISSKDFPGALAQALGVWRASRRAELADLVEAIAARCHPATISGRGAPGFHKAWMQLAESKPSPVAIGALTGTIAKNIPVAKVGTYSPDRDIRRYRAFLDRVTALAKLPHDPRTASAIADVLERAPFTIESGRRIYQPAVDLLVKIADERSYARLGAIVTRPSSKHALVRAFFAEALPAASLALSRVPRQELSDADDAMATSLLATFAAPKPTARGDIDQLMAECLAHPNEDGPREVLADALLEREDLRGEFITLQLRDARGGLSEPERKHMAALLRAHEKSWLGDLATVTKHRVWRRGFLDEAELQRNAAAEKSTWERAAKDRRLATIRRLEKGIANSTHYQSFVLSPAMSGLREVTAISVSMLGALAEGRRLVALNSAERTLETIVIEPWLREDGLRLLADAASRTGATRLSFTYNVLPSVLVARLADLPDRGRLRELRATPIGSNADWWMTDLWIWLGAHVTLGVPRLAVAFETLQVTAEQTKSGLALDIRADGDWLFETLLGKKAPKLASVVLRGGEHANAVRPVVRATLAKLGGKLAAHDRWADVVTKDRGRAPRARRS